ncbi:IclR family transcriptional regulator [Rhodoligotrophos defluvii]|uniref:IclR family transcriptional regulator n=1 Tax=Rhodoligotrophos defluvii TaxID=2561934 RepID=UPI0010C9524B|nr:IclR family transcriptional regulator [Rhodoligotrophos defluvii]
METTVVKALRVLEMLALEGEPATLTSIAQRCGITKSNAHRLLKTLEECRYVRQDLQSKTYEPTLRLWELGMGIFDRLDLRSAAARHLITLARTANESVHLSVLDGSEVIYVDKVDSTHAVRAYIRIGDRAPAYCTATGRAMLAFMPEEQVFATLRDLKKYTPNTIANAAALKAEFAAIRERGYSITHGEWQPGVFGIAAPVRGATGAIVAGLGIAGPEERMMRGDVEKMIKATLTAASAISSGLGLSGEGALVAPMPQIEKLAPKAPVPRAPAKKSLKSAS